MQTSSKNKGIAFLISFLILNVLWAVLSRVINKDVLPSPVVVYTAWPRLLELNLFEHIFASLCRIAVGMVIALTLGGLIGILMGRFEKVNRYLDPVVYFLYPIPKLALLPILMLLFGLGEVSKWLLIIFIVLPQVIVSVRDAVKETPEHYYHIYQGLNISPWRQFKWITWPASLSALLSTSRISLGTAISVLFFAENYGTERGMGYFIMDAWMRMDYPLMYAAIFTLSILGLVLFIAIDRLAKHVMKWQA